MRTRAIRQAEAALKAALEAVAAARAALAIARAAAKPKPKPKPKRKRTAQRKPKPKPVQKPKPKPKPVQKPKLKPVQKRKRTVRFRPDRPLRRCQPLRAIPIVPATIRSTASMASKTWAHNRHFDRREYRPRVSVPREIRYSVHSGSGSF